MPVSTKSPTNTRLLRVGFLPLNDAAPLVVAEERGLFAKHGLDVRLSREVGWATIREKIIYGELDAAQAPAPMLWSISLGLDSVACPVLTGLILNLHGNAITLSKKLWDEGVRTAAELKTIARGRHGERRLTFGVVFNYSSHHVLLRKWLASGGVNPDRDVRIVTVPPAQMFRNLAAGTIDGYCAGEPWNTLAIREGIGWCPTWSAQLQPGHVEKVLLVTKRFARERADQHLALIEALTEAAAWCDTPDNREPLADMLAKSGYINQSRKIIAPSFTGRFENGVGGGEMADDFHVFHKNQAGLPTEAKAWALQRDLVSSGVLPAVTLPAGLPGRLFREDIHNQALRPRNTHELVT